MDREAHRIEGTASRTSNATTMHADSGDRSKSGPRVPRRFSPPSPWRGLVERSRWIAVSGAIFAVLLLLLSSTLPSVPASGNSHAKAASSGNPAGNLSAGFPYLLNASTYPTPDQIGALGTNLSLPQLTVTSYDSNPVLFQLGLRPPTVAIGPTYLYEMVYVGVNATGATTLDFTSGRLNATAAGNLMAAPNCVVNCTHLPITWGGTIPVAGLGTSKVTADAIGASGPAVVVAATSGGVTKVWASLSYGVNGTWVALLSGGTVSGGTPRLAVQSCTALLTTLSSGTLEVTNLHLPCLASSGIGLSRAITPGTLWGPVATFGGGGGGQGPLLPAPTVTALLPNSGPVGIMVTITGSNFLPGAVAFFGTANPAFTTYVSSSTLTAVVPAVTSLTAQYDVQVCAGGQCSAPNPPADRFTYTASVYQVTPAEGLAGITVNVTGIALAASTAVYFGGVRSASVHYVSSALLTAVVPSAPPGVLDVTVGGPAHPGDQFTLVAPSATKSVGSVASAQPLFLTPSPHVPHVSEEAVVVGSTTNNSVELLTSTNNFTSYATHWIANYAVSLGSPLLSTLGPTRLQIQGGTSGEVTVADQGPYVFVGYTTRQMEENTLQVAISNDSGTHWNATYLVISTNGSIDAPQAVATPAGYVYLTWRANGNGGWSVDQQVFSDSGRTLAGVTAVPGPGGKSGTSARSLSMAVDGWQRPLYAWNLTNSSGDSVIQYTGAYLTVQKLVPFLWQRFNQTVPSDFRAFGTAPVASYERNVSTNLSALWNDLHASSWTAAQSIVLTDLYPLLTVNRTGFAYRTTSTAPYPCTGTTGTAATWLANATGPFSSGTVFEVYAAWLIEAAGCGARALFTWPGTVAGAPIPLPTVGGITSLPTPTLGRTTTPYTSGYGSANITVLTVNPNVVLLNAHSSFPGAYTFSNAHGTGCTGGTADSYYATNFVLQTPPGPLGVPVKVSSRWGLPNLYLANLTANSNGTFSLTATVSFTQKDSTYIDCSGYISQSTTYVTPTLGLPSLSFYLNGTYTTYLGTVPNAPPIKVLENPVTGVATLYSNFTASVVSAVHLFSVTEQGGAYFFGSNSTTVGKTTENLSISGAPITGTGIYYDAVYQLNSSKGTNNPTWPQLNYLAISRYTNPLWANYTYQFQVISNPVGLCLGTTPATNVTATDATITWASNQSGTGWVRYAASGAGQFQQSAVLISSNSNYCQYRYQYQAELHGLNPWSFYTVLVGVDAVLPGNPVTYENYMPLTFQTTATVMLGEWEAPIDSITGEGGGALIFWNWPVDFAGYTYLNGSLTYWPTNLPSNLTTVPIPQLQQYTVGWNSGAYGVNVTELNRNWTYGASLFLNFSYKGKTFVVNNEPFTFQYARDTSGDGLTDWEKTRGWNVTWQLDGSYSTYTAHANPKLFATNGITSDFYEKEFGLDPTRISTTNDGMMDAWNLTFDLGAGSPALPATGFKYWYENSSYVFNAACPDPEMPTPCSFTPPVVDANNLTGTTPANPGGDNGPWGAEVLWSGTGAASALSQLENLIASQGIAPLRAVTGHYNISGTSYRTMTVWGKLSWGADPLSYSTPAYQVTQGTPGDGQRVNPLGLTDVNVTVDSWSMDGLANGDGVAAFIRASSAPTFLFPNGQTDYANYTVSSKSPGGGDSYYGTFTVNFQVVPTEQYVTLNFSMVAATSSGFLWDNTSSLPVDLEDTSSHYKPFGTFSYTLNVTYQVSPVCSKANTGAILPGDNSTLSNLPIGLKRFTGEQDFVLLEINDTHAGTASLSVPDIPYVNGTAVNGISQVLYTVSLSGGMNNLLVPRSLFIHSPLGQVLLLNATNVSVPSTFYNSFLQGSWDPANWQARVLGYSSWNGSDYAAGHPGYIKVYSNTNQNCTNGAECGVVPSDLPAGTQVPSYAVGSIFALNVSNTTGLKGLLAGLLLNTSGNFTNWAFGATPYLPSLGLSSEVLKALANPVVFNQGGYGAPVYTHPSNPPTGWAAVGAAIWNAVSGTVTGLLSVAWGWVQAAASFVAYLANEVAQWGLAAINQTVSVLKQVAGAIVWALDQLAALLIQIIQQALSAAFSAVWNGIRLVLSDLENLQGTAAKALISYMNGTGTLASALATESLAYLPFFGLALALTIGVDVALGITLPASISIGFLLGLLVTVIVSAVGSGSLSSVTGGELAPVESAFNGLFAGTTSTFVAGSESVLNYTLSTILGSSLNSGSVQPLPDPPDYVGTIGLVTAGTALGLGSVKALKTPGDAAAQAGFFMSLVSFSLAIHVFAFEATQSNGCNGLPNAIVDGILGEDLAAFFLGIGGLALDVIGFKADLSTNKLMAFGGLTLDLIGMVTGTDGVVTDVGCESTATG